MYFNTDLWMRPAYTSAIDFLVTQNPQEIGLSLRGGSCDYMVWTLLKDRLGEMPRVEYVGVQNSSGELRSGTYAPPFIFSTEGQFSNFEEEGYQVVWRSSLVSVLATTKAANRVLEGWERIINTKNLLIRSNLEVYLDRNRNRLVYVKDRCQPATVVSAPSHQLPAERPLFLHVIPADVDDLPDERKQYEFDNLDFYFNDYRLGIRPGERCLAVRYLPAYAVVGIRTGENTDEGRLWEVEISFNE